MTKLIPYLPKILGLFCICWLTLTPALARAEVLTLFELDLMSKYLDEKKVCATSDLPSEEASEDIL